MSVFDEAEGGGTAVAEPRKLNVFDQAAKAHNVFDQAQAKTGNVFDEALKAASPTPTPTGDFAPQRGLLDPYLHNEGPGAAKDKAMQIAAVPQEGAFERNIVDPVASLGKGIVKGVPSMVGAGLVAPNAMNRFDTAVNDFAPTQPNIVNRSLEAAGGAVPIVASTLATGGGSVLSKAIPFVAGALMGGGGARQAVAQARDQGQEISGGKEALYTAAEGGAGAAMGFAPGGGEIAGQMAERAGLGAIGQGVSKVAGTALGMGAIGSGQTMASNLAAKGTIDPDRPLTQGVAEGYLPNVASGAVLGMGGLAHSGEQAPPAEQPHPAVAQLHSDLKAAVDAFGEKIGKSAAPAEQAQREPNLDRPSSEVGQPPSSQDRAGAEPPVGSEPQSRLDTQETRPTRMDHPSDGNIQSSASPATGESIPSPAPPVEPTPTGGIGRPVDKLSGALPDWAREAMIEEGKNPARILNEIDAARPKTVDQLANDPVTKFLEQTNPNMATRAKAGDLSAKEYLDALKNMKAQSGTVFDQAEKANEQAKAGNTNNNQVGDKNGGQPPTGDASLRDSQGLPQPSPPAEGQGEGNGVGDLSRDRTRPTGHVAVPKALEDVSKEVMTHAERIYDTVKEGVTTLVHTFAPTVGAPPKGVDALMKMKGGKDAAAYLLHQKISEWESHFAKMPEADRIGWWDKIKTGQAQADPKSQAFADFYRKLDTATYNETLKWKPNLAWLENHAQVIWKVIPGSLKEQGPGGGRRPLEGIEGWAKRHTLKDMSEGIARGGVPYDTNPLRMLEKTYDNRQKFITANRMWDSLKDLGLREFVREGQRPTNTDFVHVDDKIARVYFPADKGLVKSGEWYVDPDAGRMLKNYLSHDYVRESKVGSALMGIKGASTSMELSLSPFHAVFVTGEATGSQMGIGIRRIANLGVLPSISKAIRGQLPGMTEAGAIAKGIGEVATAPISGPGASLTGRMARRAFTDLQSFQNTPEGAAFLKKFPDAPQRMQRFFESGGKLGMHEDYRIQAQNALRNAYQEGRYGESGLRLAGEINSQIMKPLFEKYIPALKAGFWMRESSLADKEYAPRIASGEMTQAQVDRKVIASIDNRFGEMNFDNLWMNRTLKSALQLTFRSVTWKLGNLRLMLGAPAEQLAEFKSAIANRRLPLLTQNAAWLVGMSAATAILGGTVHKLATGDDPKELKDYIYPTVDKENGLRVSMPTYWRDFVHAAHSPTGYAKSSLTGEFGRIADIWQNKDFYGNQVYDPDSPSYQKALDISKHLIPLPFSLSSAMQSKQEGGNKLATAAGFAGFTQAPKYITESEAEQKASGFYQERGQGPGRTHSQQERHAAVSDLSQRVKNRDPNVQDKINKAISDNLITEKDLHTIKAKATLSKLQYRIQGLPLNQAKEVMSVATPAERKEILPEVLYKEFNATPKGSDRHKDLSRLSAIYKNYQKATSPEAKAAWRKDLDAEAARVGK